MSDSPPGDCAAPNLYRAQCRSARASRALFATLPALAMAAGCASPGPPRAPSLHLPSPATGLRAQRVGSSVFLNWTTPPNTTDGDANSRGITAVVCRQPASQPPAPCVPLAPVPTAPGASNATDALPPALASGRPALLVYRVELLNARGRSAGPSAPAYTASGEAPAPLGTLSVAANPAGPLLTWPLIANQPSVELNRTLADATSVAPAVKPPRPFQSGLLSQSPSTPPAGTVTLLASRNGADPGGVLDDSALDSHTYIYVAQRVRNLQVDGHALELRGLPSAPVTFTQRNIFPPKPPSGLASIPSGGFGKPFSIDLSWEPGPERDLLGYHIYRSERSGPFVRINPQPVSVPAFRDLAVAAGVAYTYRVTALDQHHNESAPGPEVHETIPSDQNR